MKRFKQELRVLKNVMGTLDDFVIHKDSSSLSAIIDLIPTVEFQEAAVLYEHVYVAPELGSFIRIRKMQRHECHRWEELEEREGVVQ